MLEICKRRGYGRCQPFGPDPVISCDHAPTSIGLQFNRAVLFLQLSHLSSRNSVLNLSEEQILTLAPDESSKKSGKDLANAGKWLSRSASELAIWGECKGSGAKPYLTQIDISSIAFKCSCPSRKFPCKHGLGLLLLYARDKAGFTAGPEPEWVREWLDKRTQRQEKAATRDEKPVDEVAQAKRLHAREGKVADGVAQLRIWLKDLLRAGLITVPTRHTSLFDNIVRRLIDAQAPGLAGMVRSLSAINVFEEGWESVFLDQLIRIYLLVEGYTHIDSLPALLQEDVKAFVGFTINQEELKEQEAQLDTWLVLGKQVTENDNLTTEKFWLYGISSGRYSLVLQFIIRGQGAVISFVPGMFVRAELVFFPSSAPMRAVIKRQVKTEPDNIYKTLAGWKAVEEIELQENRVLPFRSERAFIVANLRVVNKNGNWWLQDEQNNYREIKSTVPGFWKMVAISAGKPVDMALTGKNTAFTAIGLWHQKKYYTL